MGKEQSRVVRMTWCEETLRSFVELFNDAEVKGWDGRVVSMSIRELGGDEVILDFEETAR